MPEELSAYLCPYLRLLAGKGDTLGTDTHFTLARAVERDDDQNRTRCLAGQKEDARRDPGIDRLEILVLDVNLDPDALVVRIAREDPDGKGIRERANLAPHRRHRLARRGNGRQRDGQRRQDSNRSQGPLLSREGYSQRSVTVAW